jgi:hypothetical protein
MDTQAYMQIRSDKDTLEGIHAVCAACGWTKVIVGRVCVWHLLRAIANNPDDFPSNSNNAKLKDEGVDKIRELVKQEDLRVQKQEQIIRAGALMDSRKRSDRHIPNSVALT